MKLVGVVIALLLFAVGCSMPVDNSVGFNAVNNSDYRAMRELGATWVRIPVRWNITYRSPGVDDFTGVNNHVKAAHAAGLRVLVVLMGTPAQERPLGSLPQHYPDNPQHFADWTRRATQTLHPDVAQVWNEPNHPDYAQPVDIAHYADLLRASYAALKGRIPILAAAISPSKISTGIEGVSFLSQLFALGVPKLDGWAWNSYPTQQWGDGGRLREVRTLLDQHGQHQPLWMTEVGWNTDWHPASGQPAIVHDSLAWWHVNRAALRLGPYLWCEYAGSPFGLTPLSRLAFQQGA